MRTPLRLAGILLFGFLANISVQAQSGSRLRPVKKYSEYLNAWEEIDSLSRYGLNRQVADRVDSLFQVAAKDGNHPQMVRCAMFYSNQIPRLEEDPEFKVLKTLESRKEQMTGPARSFWNLLMAEFYQNYLNSHRYQLRDTEMLEDMDESADIREWSAERFEGEIDKHLDRVLELSTIRHISIKEYQPVVTLYDQSVELRPSLFDFLAHKVIEMWGGTGGYNYYYYNTPGLSDIEDLDIYALPTEFAAWQNASKDESDLGKVYRLYQELTRYHLNDKDKLPLAQLTLDRMKQLYGQDHREDKDALYLSAMEDMEKWAAKGEAKVLVVLAKADQLTHMATRYNYGAMPEYREYYFKAAENYKWAETHAEDTLRRNRAMNALHEMTRLDLDLSVAQTMLPGTEHLYALAYRNTPKVYFKLVKVSQEEMDRLMEKSSRALVSGLADRSGETWTEDLPWSDDHQYHRVELVLPKRDLGHYALLASAKPDFSTDKNIVSIGAFWTTRINVDHRTNDKVLQVRVSDSENGAPKVGAKVKLYKKEYNYRKGSYDYKLKASYTADENGLVSHEAKGSDSFEVEVTHGSDHYKSSNGHIYYYNYYGREDDSRNNRLTILIDRGIYRPGQEVHFKAIFHKQTKQGPQLRVGIKRMVTLYDYNSQVLDTLTLVTNQFGSMAGKFELPSSMVTGHCRIVVEDEGNKYFQVEEYKRPKFFVEIPKIKDQVQLDDSVKVIGFAKGYSGNRLSGAKVTYYVSRSVNYPYWWYWRGGYSYHPAEIIHSGDTVTGDDGSFILKFLASRSEDVRRKDQPTYTYTIQATVTDVNGETHAQTTYVYAGERGFNLSSNLSGLLDSEKDSLKVEIWAQNLNGTQLEESGSYRIYRLKPQDMLRDRLWQNPDVFKLTEAGHDSRFPYDIYSDSSRVLLLERESVEVLSGDFKTDTAKLEIEMAGISSWKQGEYLLEMKGRDQFGNEIVDYTQFQVVAPSSTEAALNQPLYMYTIETPTKPGEQLKLLVGSAVSDAKVFVEVSHGKEILERKWIELSNGQSLYSFTTPKGGYGNYYVNVVTSLLERNQTNSQSFYLVREQAYLDVELSSFRNKVYPNSEEEWTLTVKDHEKSGVKAEALAAMYDASLDEFAGNYWGLNFFEDEYANLYWNTNVSTGMQYARKYNFQPWYSRSTWYGQNDFRGYLRWSRYGGYYRGDLLDAFGEDSIMLEGQKEQDNDRSRNTRGGTLKKEAMARTEAEPNEIMMDMADEETAANAPAKGTYGWANGSADKDQTVVSGLTTADSKNGEMLAGERELAQTIDLGEVQARKNFNETAFFLPQLMTDDQGNTTVKFTMPESLTKWKFMALAHTQQMQVGQTQESILTQKDLMVFTNVPRFVRTGDRIVLTARLSSMRADKTLEGVARLEVLDARTEEPIAAPWTKFDDKSFKLKPNGNGVVKWELNIPASQEAIIVKVVAGTGEFSDGEQHLLPVLPNKQLVTESMPFTVHGKGDKNLDYARMKELLAEGVEPHLATLEFTANPAWYAVQSLPYMMEYPHECSEQIFSRYYANALAGKVVQDQPRIQEMFKRWENETPETFLSNLEKNQELKQVILEETPWVLQAQNEQERKKRVSMLFDMNRMQREKDKALDELAKRQVSSGAWPWFKGMPESRFITRHIIAGLGHLKHLGALQMDYRERQMVNSALDFMDRQIVKDHRYWLKYHSDTTDKYLSSSHLHYMYARSFFPERSLSKSTQEAHEWIMKQARKHWQQMDLYSMSMLALVFERKEETKLAERISASLRDRAIHDEEKGVYWAENQAGWYWYQAPVETQAMLIEAFAEVDGDTAFVDGMKRWLLMHKRTNDWETTKATAEACYALLIQGSDMLSVDNMPQLVWGGDPLITDSSNAVKGIKVEPVPGVGYFKTTKKAEELASADAELSVKRQDRGSSWGALYFQYWQDVDKVTRNETPLNVKRNLYKVVVDGSSEKLVPLDKQGLKVGDKVRVVIVLDVDREMEFIHLKDMRAASLEPVEQISGHRYQKGLWYYQSIRDASANYFFERLAPGHYSFEYDLFVEQEGDFSNGFAQIQSMYAPEFGAHSKGMRLEISNK